MLIGFPASDLTSIAIDHFGLLYRPVHEESAWRIADGALISRALRSCLRFDGGAPAAF